MYRTLYINTGLNVAESGTKNTCNAKVKDGFKEKCIFVFLVFFIKLCLYLWSENSVSFANVYYEVGYYHINQTLFRKRVLNWSIV